MTVNEKSAGQALVETIENWFASFIAFPNPEYALVCAMWAINTWVFQVFDAVGYLAITASTKRAGKSILLDSVALISKNSEKAGAGTDATIFRLMEQWDGWCSLFFDEAERMASGKVGLLRTLMNFGYRKGETVPRTMPNGLVHKFPVFGPKAFALIGDLMDTLRDRAILVVMERGVPKRLYNRSQIEREAEAIRFQIEAYLKAGALKSVPLVSPEWLADRDQEIWTPIFSLAHAMKLDKKTIKRLEMASADMTARKSQPIKRIEDVSAELQAENAAYAERALRDLASVIREGEKHVFSAVAVERMREISTGPWRMYKGTGLTENKLADLLSRFEVGTCQGFMGSGRGAKRGPNRNGYKASVVLGAAAKLAE